MGQKESKEEGTNHRGIIAVMQSDDDENAASPASRCPIRDEPETRPPPPGHSNSNGPLESREYSSEDRNLEPPTSTNFSALDLDSAKVEQDTNITPPVEKQEPEESSPGECVELDITRPLINAVKMISPSATTLVLFCPEGKTQECMPMVKDLPTNIKTVIVAPSCVCVTKVAPCFLYDCSSVNEVDFSGFVNVSEIGKCFLRNCKSIKKISFRGFTKLEKIDTFFLDGCCNLESADLSALHRITLLPDNFMCGCVNLLRIDLTPLILVDEIGDEVLQNCTNLRHVNISTLRRLAEVGKDFLYDCVNLVTVVFPPRMNLVHCHVGYLQGCRKLRCRTSNSDSDSDEESCDKNSSTSSPSVADRAEEIADASSEDMGLVLSTPSPSASLCNSTEFLASEPIHHDVTESLNQEDHSPPRGYACPLQNSDGGCLGKGGQGIVWEVVRIADDALFAWKTLHFNRANSAARESIRNEIRLHKSLPHHPNVITVVDTFDGSSGMEIVMERMDGSLDKFPYLNGRNFMSVILQSLRGLIHLHKNNILHRDLKPGNMLYNFNTTNGTLEVKISDFGHSKLLTRQSKDTNRLVDDPIAGVFSASRCGTYGFRAPEVKKSQVYSHSSDVFAWGCSMLTLAEDNFTPDDGNKMSVKIGLKSQVTKLLEKCRLIDKDERPSPEELLDEFSMLGTSVC